MIHYPRSITETAAQPVVITHWTRNGCQSHEISRASLAMLSTHDSICYLCISFVEVNARLLIHPLEKLKMIFGMVSIMHSFCRALLYSPCMHGTQLSAASPEGMAGRWKVLCFQSAFCPEAFSQGNQNTSSCSLNGNYPLHKGQFS